jgi:hypothetical protein
MVIHACNTSTWEAEEEDGGQPGLGSETLFKKKVFILILTYCSSPL